MDRCLLTLMAFGLLAVSGPSDAQSPEIDSAPPPFEDMMLAARLARWGTDHDDPVALVMAARLRQATDQTRVERVDGHAATYPGPVERWLTEAESLAGGDPRVADLIAEVRATGFKGRSGGPRVSLGTVRPRARNSYVERFEPARTAVVYVEGDGDTDLELVVREADGTAVCTRDEPGDIKMCVWTPTRSGGHTVEIRNDGMINNAYSLATN
jgi:hypothetical protein